MSESDFKSVYSIQVDVDDAQLKKIEQQIAKQHPLSIGAKIDRASQRTMLATWRTAKKEATDLANILKKMPKNAMYAGGAALGMGYATKAWGNAQGRDYFQAAGMGAKTSEVNAFKQTYGKLIVNSDEMLNKIAAAQADPTKSWLFAAAGTSWEEARDKSPATVAAEMLPYLKERFEQSGQTEPEAQATGLLGFADMDTLRRLKNMPREDLANRKPEYERREQEQRIAEESQRKAADAAAGLEGALKKIENAFTETIGRYAGQIDALANATANGIKAFADAPAVQEAIKDTVTYLNSPELKADIAEFALDAKQIKDGAKDVVEFMQAVGLVTHGAVIDIPKAIGETAAGLFDEDARKLQRKEAAAAEQKHREYRKRHEQVSGDKEQSAVNYFMSQGWTKDQAAGIAANLKEESQFNERAIGDSGKAFGIGQWHPDRQEKFKRQFGKSIKDSTFDEQLQFVQWELTNTERAAGEKLRKATTAKESGSVISQFYERPAAVEAAKEKRGEMAINIAMRQPEYIQPIEKKQSAPVEVKPASMLPDFTKWFSKKIDDTREFDQFGENPRQLSAKIDERLPDNKYGENEDLFFGYDWKREPVRDYRRFVPQDAPAITPQLQTPVTPARRRSVNRDTRGITVTNQTGGNANIAVNQGAY